MKVLHTSDWHLGRHLHGYKRYDVFEEFLRFLADYIKTNSVEVLLVAGDIFDTNTPSNKSLEMYYRFLGSLVNSVCKNIIITSGNHDSASVLDAPKELLKFFNIQVIGSISENLNDEIIMIKDSAGQDSLIVCAVPFLRDRDIRFSEAGEGIEDKDKKMKEGIKEHYQKVCNQAEKIRKDSENKIPIIAMGHLFTVGGVVKEDDGVRELFVGSLAHVHHSIFPDFLDFVALGHLHIPQKVSGSDKIRYSGSPLPMGFGEAKQQKIMCLLNITKNDLEISEINLPVFQKLDSIKGDIQFIENRLSELVLSNQEIFVEIIYDGETLINNLQEICENLITESQIHLVKIKNKRIYDRVSQSLIENETLEEIDSTEVFKRCMQVNDIPEEMQAGLMDTFSEVIAYFNQKD